MRIYLDPGHGGKDPGASANGIREATVALDIATRANLILTNEYGATVRMSRTRDELAGGDRLSVSQSLQWRVDDARKWNADLFVSVHLNAGGGNGFETYRHADSKASVDPQAILHRAITRHLPGWAKDRGTKSARFTVLSSYRFAYAILTENLFVDHAQSAEWLKVESNREALARGHAEGIAEIAKLKKTDKGGSTAVWDETLSATELARSRFPDSYSLRAEHAVAHILGLAYAIKYGRIAPRPWMLERWPDLREDGYSEPSYNRTGYGYSRAGFEEAEKNGDKLDTILDHLAGLDTSAILERIDQRHAERSAQIAVIGDRLDSVQQALDDHADGTLDAEEVVRRIGELLSGGTTS